MSVWSARPAMETTSRRQRTLLRVWMLSSIVLRHSRRETGRCTWPHTKEVALCLAGDVYADFSGEEIVQGDQ